MHQNRLHPDIMDHITRQAIPPQLEASALAMSFIFKKSDWCDQVLKLNLARGSPVPILLGKDLAEVCKGNTHGKNLLLLVNDWSGECFFLRDCFFECLQDHEPMAANSVVTFKDSKLNVYVHDAIYTAEWLPIPNITRFISSQKDVFALYYHRNKVEKLAIGNIQGIQEYKGEEAIKEICSLKLEFRGGEVVYRVLKDPSMATKVVNVRPKDGGREWVSGWRKARPGEQADIF
ncbi:hypothetical protein BGZ63DRAFT_379591 [Mariannaea sp. PMI_226]|nr:hypothetical protein BGZ63DRAFT_379591 [Mariannaea sp. PMI_226]